ncbi:MAG: hypothetical protein KIS78_34385 [Labilithrix sp.]|nr:hypothetical protein [Labilithrix sp.]MCW5837532.1 hypothetical protein [Labilithrix sp.]
MPATRGNLQLLRLQGISDTAPSTFQLPSHLGAYLPMPATMTLAERKRMNRRGFGRGELRAMGKVVASYSSDFELQTLLGTDDHMTDEHVFTDAEYLFHGSPTDWDTLHASGGLKSAGDNENLSQHVHSSATYQTLYVSGTRVLSVAKCFAKGQDGWVYMFLSRHGVGIAHATHKQAEVAVLNEVPVEDIVLFKQLSSPDDVYLNLDFRWGPLPQAQLATCLRAIGGGQYGQGIFWT